MSAHPTINPLLDQAAIATWLGFGPNERLAIEKHLRKHKIPYVYGRGGKICTTLNAIDSTLAGTPHSDTGGEEQFF